ncbi:RecX family transcriptional regulator [Herbiconiux moechotypicola]|uniref:Regulatory protein RecX n=1 Tax=Herbiconiux moechotypicola TaxID=637393 RepID=A0ABP5QHJ9_9MICO|nr:regulatory protein RecX [Herbiconiux moechotypicola]MCS5729886.1 RecX family transcriptional regulator [Herbiconiux moechotypicola]
MNDVVSLEAVRRGRARSRAVAASGAADVSHFEHDRAIDDQAIDAGAIDEESDEERLERIGDSVLRALGRRQLSTVETHELLVSQGASIDEAEVLVARYEELGYLDDFALAEAMVSRLSERSHKSKAAIGRELSARKIPGEFVTAALEQLDEETEFDLAVEAAMKRVAQLSGYDEQTVERRLMGFLTRRGFTSGVVREATRRALATRRRSTGPRFV